VSSRPCERGLVEPLVLSLEFALALPAGLLAGEPLADELHEREFGVGERLLSDRPVVQAERAVRFALDGDGQPDERLCLQPEPVDEDGGAELRRGDVGHADRLLAPGGQQAGGPAPVEGVPREQRELRRVGPDDLDLFALGAAEARGVEVGTDEVEQFPQLRLERALASVVMVWYWPR
jgi:hypothetical protein